MRLDAFEVQLDANRRLFVDGETVSMTLEIGEFGLGKELNLLGLRIKDEEIAALQHRAPVRHGVIKKSSEHDFYMSGC